MLPVTSHHLAALGMLAPGAEAEGVPMPPPHHLLHAATAPLDSQPSSASVALDRYLHHAESQLPLLLHDQSRAPAHHVRTTGQRLPLAPLPGQCAMPIQTSLSTAPFCAQPPVVLQSAGARPPLPPPSYRIKAIAQDPDYTRQLDRYDELLSEVAHDLLGRPRDESPVTDASDPELAAAASPKKNDHVSALSKLERSSQKLAAMRARQRGGS